jgi:hypothetical protein
MSLIPVRITITKLTRQIFITYPPTFDARQKRQGCARQKCRRGPRAPRAAQRLANQGRDRPSRPLSHHTMNRGAICRDVQILRYVAVYHLGVPGAQRPVQLAASARTAVLTRGHQPVGFAQSRRFGRGWLIGPVVAPDGRTAPGRRFVRVSRGACAAAVRDGDGPGARGGRATGEPDGSRAAGEPGAPRGGRGAGVFSASSAGFGQKR